MLLSLLRKSCKHLIKIGSGSIFPLLFLQPAEQSSHEGSFVHKAANVALRLGQTNCLCEDVESLSLLLTHLVSQGLQEPHLNDMSPALACSRTLEHWLQALESKVGASLGKQDPHACHLFAFSG